MKRHVLILAAMVGSLSLVGASKADTVYDTTAAFANGGSPYFAQQYGYNYYYLGDTPTVASSGQLGTISVVFGTSSSSTYDPSDTPFNYTPDLELDIYQNAADAAAGTGLIGSATNDSVTFHNDGVVNPTVGYNYEDEQLVTFDFTSQSITLPSTFVITYHDHAADGITSSSDPNFNAAAGFSVGITDQGATVGTASPQGFFNVYPNSAPPGTLSYSWGQYPIDSTSDEDAGYNIEAQVTTVPLPVSAEAGLALLAGLALFGGVKRMRSRTA